MDFIIKEITIDKLYLIEGLWVKLNQLHLQDSKFFKEHYAENTFEKRCEKFKAMDRHDVRIEIIENLESTIVGYCISTVSKGVGGNGRLSSFLATPLVQMGYNVICLDLPGYGLSQCNKRITYSDWIDVGSKIVVNELSQSKKVFIMGLSAEVIRLKTIFDLREKQVVEPTLKVLQLIFL